MKEGLIIAIIFILWAGFSFPQNSMAAQELPFIDDDFVLFWPNPIRAYPDIPLDSRFVVYEKDNQPLAWQLFNAPSNMAVDSSGKVSWTPTEDDIGSYDLTIRVTREDGDYRERSFTLTVGTDDFLFVSPTGSDSNSGTVSEPFATLEHAMRAIQDGNGKTIYLRGGTYHEHYAWETDGISSPWRGKNFSASDPVEIRSYPNEWAILDADLSGHGLMAYDTNYVLIDNLEVQDTNWSEGGGIIVSGSDHVVVRDTIVHDAHWPATANCTGYKLQSVSDIALDKTEAYNNGEVGNDFWNSSNYLVYTEAPSSGNIYIMNSFSHDSIVGFKIKHAGPAKLILHNNKSVDDHYSFAPGSDYSSVRYSSSYGAEIGIYGGMADPSAFGSEALLMEHNTIVNASSAGIYFAFHTNGSIIRNNIIYNDLGVAGTGEDDRRIMEFWIYDDNAGAYSLSSDYNLFFSPSEENIVRYGHTNYNYSFTTWENKGQDVHSLFADPLFFDIGNQDFQPENSSPACGLASDGGDAGSLPCRDLGDDISPSAPSGLAVF